MTADENPHKQMIHELVQVKSFACKLRLLFEKSRRLQHWGNNNKKQK